MKKQLLVVLSLCAIANAAFAGGSGGSCGMRRQAAVRQAVHAPAYKKNDRVAQRQLRLAARITAERQQAKTLATKKAARKNVKKQAVKKAAVRRNRCKRCLR